MPYNVFGCYFGATFETLAEAWRRSIESRCPTADVTLDEIQHAPAVKHVRQSAPDNLAKLARWRKEFYTADRPTLFLDVDTYCRRNLEPVWDALDGADIGYTWRPHKTRPVIGGFLAARNTEGAEAFLDAWFCLAASLIVKPVECWDRMALRGGLNQACLSKLTKHPPDGCTVKALSPYEWNLCDEIWGDLGDETRLVHVKGELRDEVLGGHVDGPYSDIVKEWRQWLIQEPETTPAAGV